MSKSLEALERIETVFHCNKQGKKNCYAHFMSPSKAIEEYYKDYNIVKQDLEAYEQLKQDHDKTLINNGELVVKVADLQKENQELIVNKNVAQAVALNQKREIGELKDQISYLQEEFEGWQSAYEWSQTENSILKSENEELRSKYNDLMLDFKMFDFNTLKQENEKLKKVLEILKEHNLTISYIPDISLPHLTLNDYGDGVTLTQEEFDLLKEVLE